MELYLLSFNILHLYGSSAVQGQLKCIILAVTELGLFLFSVLDYLDLQDNFNRHMVRRDEPFDLNKIAYTITKQTPILYILCLSYTMVCPCVQVDTHDITILYHLHSDRIDILA